MVTTNRLGLLTRSITKSSAWDAVFLKNRERLLQDDDVKNYPYRKSDLVYTCISTTARVISHVPFYVWEFGSGGNRDRWEPVYSDNPWQKLVNNPNTSQSAWEFLFSIIGFFMLDGEVFIIPFPPTEGIPMSLWVVRKTYMEPVKNKGSGQLIGWRYRPSNDLAQSYMLSTSEVIYFRNWNPYDPIRGLSPLEAGEMSVVGDYKAGRYNNLFFDQGAVPGGMLSTEQKLGQLQFERIKKQFEEEHQGYRKAHRLAILEQGLQYSRTGLSQKDMEFVNLKKITREGILQVLGMKKAVISVTDDLNYATAKEQYRDWWQDTNLPLMEMVSIGMTRSLLTLRGLNLRFRFDVGSVPALREDFSSKVGDARKLFEMGFTGNEVNDRLELGFDNKPWRDYWWIPLNLGQAGAGFQGGRPPGEGEGNQVAEQIADMERRSLRILKPVGLDTFEEEKVLIPPQLQEQEQKQEDSPVDLPKREKELQSLQKALDNKLKPLEDRLESKLNRVFFEMRKKTLKLLYSGVSRKGVDDVGGEEFLDAKDQLGRYAGRVHEVAMAEGIKSVIDEIGFGVAFDLDDPLALNELAERRLKVRGVINTLKKRLRETLHTGTAQGETIEQLAERVRGVFQYARSNAGTIARTEVISASNFGRAGAINGSGYEEKEWFTALDERVRPAHPRERGNHRAMHGVRVKVGESWRTPSGNILKHPGDYGAPGYEVINCRCIETVVPGTLAFDKEREKKKRKWAAVKDKDADAWMHKHFQGWVDSLDKYELHSIEGYQHIDFKEVNAVLRGRGKEYGLSAAEIGEIRQTKVANISKAIKKGKVPEDLTCFRCVSTKHAEKFKNNIGLVIKDKGFTSTSISNEWFAKNSDLLIKGDFSAIEIRVPKGTKAGGLGAMPDLETVLAKEKELLLDKGTNFKIVGTGKVNLGKGRIIDKVILEVV